MIEPMPHLEPSDIAAYAEGVLAETERERAEQHLSRCATCRDELTVAIRSPRRGRPRSARWIPAVAAAAVVALLIGRGLLVDGSDPVLRDGGRGSTFAVVEPPEGASRPVGAVRMTWRAADDATYRVTIMNVDGDIVWSTSTGDTTLVVPSNVGLTAGERYFWFVDALFSDGTSATTGASSFATVQDGL